MTVSYVVDLIGWYRKTILTILLFWSVLHDADYAFYDVIHIGEVALTVAVVEDFNGFTLYKFIGEAEVCHVRTTCRAVDGEEAKTCRGYVVEFGVGVSHQLIALLGGCIKAYRIVYLIVRRIRNLLIAAIYGG